MANHGVFVTEAATGVVTPNQAGSGIPFVIGVAPLSHADADTRATALTPVLATSYAEAEEQLGYSDNWIDYGISEFMYHHFKLCAQQPVVFLPLTETIATEKFSGTGSQKEFTIAASPKPLSVQKVTVAGTEVEVASYNKSTGKITLVNAPVSGTDNVTAYYLTRPTASDAASAVDKIDLCMAMFGIIPDLIVAPGFSQESTVAAAMAAKAGAINGIFKGRAIVDIDSEANATYTAAVTAKNGGSYDETEIICWPCGKLGDLIIHGSTLEAGRIAMTDGDNSGVPYESPSNKTVSIDGLCTSDGTEIVLTLAQANILNANGINTFINFIGGWKAWGNITGCYPANTDVKDYIIPIARMFDWVGNSLIKTFWGKLDDPMNRRLIDTILDSANIWLNGLVGRGYLLGARVEMLESENPLTNLMAGQIALHVYMTPPSPAQEIDFILEYDASYVQTALQA